MKIRVHSLPHKEALRGTPHEATSREAAVPPSSYLTEVHNHITESVSLEKAEKVELVEEEAIFQIEKKKRLSLNSSVVSKTSLDQFQFAAKKEHSSMIRRHKMHFKGRLRMAEPVRNLKTSSFVEQSASICRYTGTVVRKMTAIKRSKITDAHIIEFNAHYHPPFKRLRLSPAVLSVSTFSQVYWLSSGFGVSNAPPFVW